MEETTMPLVTFLISAYDRPDFLWGSLGSLIVQTNPNWNAFVCCNATDPEMIARHKKIIGSLGDSRIFFVTSHGKHVAWDCYWAAEQVFNLLKDNNPNMLGTWVGCPSDDSYYTPEYIEKMTETDCDLVYCGLVYDARCEAKKRAPIPVWPINGHIDKTNFLVKSDKWIGFPHKNYVAPGPSSADGLAIEEMVRRGYTHRYIDWLMCIHN